MMVYRLAENRFINDKGGVGAKLFGGRWNEVNTACIYTSAHISLALLEKYVHAQGAENMHDIGLLTLQLPENKSLIYHIDDKQLKDNWPDDLGYTQWLGQQLLQDEDVLGFSAPSAIIPQERNVIINPSSKFFGEVKFISVGDFYADYRLLNLLMER